MKNINLSTWWKNFLTGVLATAVGVGLTFEVNNRVERHKHKQAQRQAAMMVIYDIDDIIYNFIREKETEDAFFKAAMYLFTHQEELETIGMDSLWMAAEYLVKNPANNPVWADDSSEKVFSSSMDVIHDLGDITFYDNVQECYLKRRTLLRLMETSSTFARPISDSFVLEYRKHVSAADMDGNGMMNHRAMAGLLREIYRQPEVPLYLQKYFMRDREYQSFIDHFIRRNQENKYLMNITDEDMERYIAKHVNKVMPAKPKLIVGQWDMRENRQHRTYLFRKDRTLSLTVRTDHKIGTYVESENVNVYMLAPLTYTMDGEWALKDDSLQLDFHPESLQIVAFDLNLNDLPRAALEAGSESIETRKEQYRENVLAQLRRQTAWSMTQKVSLGQSGQIMFWENQYTMPWGQAFTDKSQLLKSR